MNNKNDNLKMHSRLSLESADDFIIHENMAYIYGKYCNSDNGFLSVVDISDSYSPKIVSQIQFKNSISCIQIKENILYVMEQCTGFHLFNISDPSKPERMDLILFFEQDMRGFDFIGNSIIAIIDTKLVIFEICDSNSLHQTITLEGFDYCTSFIVSQDDIYFTDNKVMLQKAIFTNNTLKVTNTYRYKKFIGKGLINSKNKIYIAGNDSLVVVDKSNPENILSSVVFKNCNLKEKKSVLMLKNGNSIIFHHGFAGSCSCFFFDEKAKKLNELFQLYERNSSKEYIEMPIVKNKIGDSVFMGIDITDELMGKITAIDHVRRAEKNGRYLYTAHSDLFIIWEISEDSILMD